MSDDLERIQVLLENRRWFAGDPTAAGIVQQAVIPVEPPLTHVLVESDGATYQLFVDDDGAEIDDKPDHAYSLLRMISPEEHPVSVRHLGLEQSNTSFVFDERIMLKLYRKLIDGPNPDVDVPEALRGAGFENVPEVLARWQVDGRDLASVQPFLAGANDGWSLALASLRQLFGEGSAPEDAGGDFAPEARRIGVITAALHTAMAKAFGIERTDAGPRIRVHGDFHLGQVLRTDERWYVVDFEGEPGRPEHERLALSSPLKDVAGMVRSFDYAAAIAVREQDEDVHGLARAWERHNRAQFLDAYWDASHGDGLVPSVHADAVALLSHYELEKARYEVEYERAHRPSWVDIPEAAVARLVDQS